MLMVPWFKVSGLLSMTTIAAGCGAAANLDGGQNAAVNSGDGGHATDARASRDCSDESTICAAPPPGCVREGPECVDGHLGCGAMICPESGVGPGDCAGQLPPLCPEPFPGCTFEGPECVDGHLGCGTLVCSPQDAGSYSCAVSPCNAAIGFCWVLPSCVATPAQAGTWPASPSPRAVPRGAPARTSAFSAPTPAGGPARAHQVQPASSPTTPSARSPRAANGSLLRADDEKARA